MEAKEELKALQLQTRLYSPHRFVGDNRLELAGKPKLNEAVYEAYDKKICPRLKS